MYFVCDQLRFLTAREMAAMQGFSREELGEAVGSNATDERFVADLVGNGFATTLFAATLVVALVSWTRQLHVTHDVIITSIMDCNMFLQCVWEGKTEGWVSEECSHCNCCRR